MNESLKKRYTEHIDEAERKGILVLKAEHVVGLQTAAAMLKQFPYDIQVYYCFSFISISMYCIEWEHTVVKGNCNFKQSLFWRIFKLIFLKFFS